MAEFHLQTPLQKEDIIQLHIGDIVYFTGKAWTARSRLHKRVFEEDYELPFLTDNNNVLVHVGPVVIRDGNEWKLTSFNPTSSIQLDNWGPQSVKQWELRAIIGKTTMGLPTMEAMKNQGCIHATPMGVTPMLFLEQISIEAVYWLEELGSIEAAWILKVTDFGPFLVDIDCAGNNYFNQLRSNLEKNKLNVYKKLGISHDFKYTPLY